MSTMSSQEDQGSEGEDINEPPNDFNWFMFEWDRDRTSSMLQIEDRTGVRVMQVGGFKTAIGERPMVCGGKYYFEI